MGTIEIKTCLHCHNPKPLNNFSVRTDNGRRRNVCQACRTTQLNKWNSANVERRRVAQRIYNALPKCKEQRRTYKKYMREHKYNLYLWRIVRERARKLQLPFTIEPSDIVIPEVCPVLGIKLLPCRKRIDDSSPTLDKINNELGYIKGNVAVISWKANRLKSDGTSEDHERIANYIKKVVDIKSKIC